MGRSVGILVALEGIDGAGKTTQARLLVKWLRERRFDACYTYEPTRGPFGRILRSMAHARNADPRLETLLFAADRLHHLIRVINPLLERGLIIVSDRYLHSSLAYQSVTTGDQRWVEEINKFARRPDLGIYLDVSASGGLSRLARRTKRSRFENESFLEQVREKYLEYVERGELVKVDAGKSVDEVFFEITSIVENSLKGRR
jgi:dTMP kinase